MLNIEPRYMSPLHACIWSFMQPPVSGLMKIATFDPTHSLTNMFMMNLLSKIPFKNDKEGCICLKNQLASIDCIDAYGAEVDM